MGLLTILWDEEILERGETRRDRDELFRVKVVGSTPAGPTILLQPFFGFKPKFISQFLVWRQFLVDKHIKFYRKFVFIINLLDCKIW